MPKLHHDTFSLKPDGPGVYHVIPHGSETPTATLQYFKNRAALQQWGLRPYGQTGQPWTWRPSMTEALILARRDYVTPDVPRETKGES
jgi:hypothetical protein